jgi:hypothetical protein
MGTSSANPAKLTSYSTDGLALLETLRSKSNAVNDALGGLSGPHVPAFGDAHTALTDLVGDWLHLDEFVGDVANGFRQADGGSGVVTVSDTDILRLGHVGFADRDEAIEAAQAAQRRLDELLAQHPEDIDQAELDALLADIARGQHDTAFAVTFSEAVGVEGYVDTMALIRNVYTTTDGTWRVTDQGMAYAAMLGTTLTTALRTHDYNNTANLAPGDRLSYDFVEDLTSGYQGGDYAGREHNDDPNNLIPVRLTSNGVSLDRDLSVLLSFSDPPTWMAVDIANHRLSPMLERYDADVPAVGSFGGSDVLIWGDDHSGIVTNYATMLGRNSDASTLWLNQTGQEAEHDNLYLVIERAGGANIDDGAALAQIVENGLTNGDVHEPVPGAPSYVEGGLMRETLMERAIDYTAGIGEIANGHLNGAFAAGVDHNMNVIDERINAPFGYDEGERPEGVLDEYRNTHDFLRETMRDGDAARDIYLTIQEYGMEQATSLPVDDPTTPENEREARLRQLGRIQGVASEAEENAGVGSVLDEMLQNGALGPTPGSATNFGVGVVAGFIPGLGSVHEVSQALGVSAGDFVNWGAHELFNEDYDNLSREQQEAAAQRATDRLNRAIWLSNGLYEADTPEGAALRESAQGQPFVNADGSIKTSMTDAEMQAYREWAWDNVGNDDQQGPIYTEHGDIGTGYNDVHEGETDLNDRH